MPQTTDLQTFLRGARNGDRQSPAAFINHCRKFDAVVLWGAGNLGKAIGRKLLDLGVVPQAYWDTRADSLHETNGIMVVPPFTGGFDAQRTLILFCIGNVAVGPNIFRQLANNGWPHVVHGNDLLQGLLCPLTNERPANVRICNRLDICSVCSCERLNNIVRLDALRRSRTPASDALSFDRVHFIVNNVCNMKCTHCFLYINSYPKEHKQNVKTGQLLADIDRVMAVVSSFGVVNVFGGEPFMHKDIARIIERILEHNNFGALLVNTNCIARIKPEQLAPLRNPRVRLAFSNYLEVLDDRKKTVFFDNIERARALGVEAQYQNTLPTWNISSTLHDLDDSEETMIGKKATCGVRFLYVFDGKIFPCAFSLSIHDLQVADYRSDYIVLNPAKSHETLRGEIRGMLDRPCYRSCGHCESFSTPALVAGAAEQGYSERYALPSRPIKRIPIVTC